MRKLLRARAHSLIASGVLAIGLIAASFGGASAQQASRFEPLAVERPKALELLADPRFDAAGDGTVEFTMAIAGLQPGGGPDGSGDRTLCIAEHGTGETLNWRLSLSVVNGKDLLHFGRSANEPRIEVPMDLRGTGFHHFTFITAGGRTHVAVDGVWMGGVGPDNRTPLPGIEFGYRPAVPEGLPLTFGCNEGPTAKTWISSFRLWDTVMTASDLAILRKSPGAMTKQPSFARSLLAYSMFTTAAKEVRLKGSRVQFTEMKGAAGGTPFFYRRPRSKELYGIYLTDDGKFQLRLQALEFDIAKRNNTLTDGKTPADLSLPVILPRRSTDPIHAQAAYVEALLNHGPYDDDADPDATFGALRELLIKYRERQRSLALGGDSALFAAAGDYQVGVIKVYALILEAGMRFRSIVASYTSTGLKAMRIGTNGIDAAGLWGFREDRQDVFDIEIPVGTRLEGVAGRVGEDGVLRAIALAYSDDEQARTGNLAATVTQGVWVNRHDPVPIGDAREHVNTEYEAFVGTYTDQTTYRFKPDMGGNILQLLIDAPGPKSDPPRTHVFVHKTGNEWSLLIPELDKAPADGDTLWFYDDHIKLGHSGDIDGKATMLVRPPPYPAGDDNKLPWGATFSLEHRPNGVIANFKGYNPARMLARDYQATTGADKLLFKMPDDMSSAYTATDSRLIVPHGLFFSLDSKGSERADANKIDSDMERQRSWTIGLGGSIGIPLVASFSADGSHQESQKTIDSESLSMVQNRAIVTHYGLVLDKSRIELSDEFRGRIIELRNRMVADFPIDWQAFFESYGTHYPYAVTYGGMAWSETTIETSTKTLETSTDDKVSASASGVLDDVLSVGVNASSDYSEGSKSAQGSTYSRTNYGTYGGSFSKGGGWSVGRGEELPVLLDLRPIMELLSPSYFDDPVIYGDLRAAMKTEYEKYNDDIAAKITAQWNWSAGQEDQECNFGEVCFMTPGGFP